MQRAGALEQHVFGFRNVGIGDAAVDRANRRTCLMVIKSYTLSAFGGDNVIDILRDRGVGLPAQFPWDPAGVNCGVGTFGFARPAVNAIAGNDCRHLKFPASRVSKLSKDLSWALVYKTQSGKLANPIDHNRTEFFMSTLLANSFQLNSQNNRPAGALVRYFTGLSSCLLKA